MGFLAFIFWNGGVVLGDKSNHIATIHLPQMLYIWAYFTFFSFPLLLPTAAQKIGTLFLSRWTILSTLRNIIIWTIAIGLTEGVVHYNTVVHPFTLADNRHYMFYIFRYFILRHWSFRYILAPIYLTCGWLTVSRLSTNDDVSLQESSSTVHQQLSKRKSPNARQQSLQQSEGQRVTFVLVWLIATSLSLITAPLVEPRYFIVPWVIWRLYLPQNGYSSSVSTLKSVKSQLWLETIWFVSINFVTGYIFLYKGFSWFQEPGNVQRFMW
jgi:alpha-1,2-glucosyltransferase